MRIKPKTFLKGLCFLLLICSLFLLAACRDPEIVSRYDDYYNPFGGQGGRHLHFSHSGGLHPAPFRLSITAPEGSEIFFSTDGSIPSPERADDRAFPHVHRYTAPIQIRNRSGQPNVLATRENSIQFYMYPNDPRGYVPVVFIPRNDQVPKGTVIRAVAVNEAGQTSPVVTGTFFIGGNLNHPRYGNHRIVSLVADPLCLVDPDRGIMVRGHPNNRWDWPGNPETSTEQPGLYNFRRRGRDNWERGAHMEIFEAGRGSSVLNIGVGIRIRGGWSRGHGQKSFNVFFRDEWDRDHNSRNLLNNFYLIPGATLADRLSPLRRYKSFMLRSGGNDHYLTKFQDVFTHTLLRDRAFSTQNTVPAILFLNGEYWGPYNFSERYSDHWLEHRYGIDRRDVVMIEAGALDEGLASDFNLYRDLIDMRHLNMAVPANFEAFKNAFCIDNFIDYWAAQIYIFNRDWPENNFHLWRVVRNSGGSNPYNDGRWRYKLHDTDISMGLYVGGDITYNGITAFRRVLNIANGGGWNNDHPQLFLALLRNPEFARRFVNTMMDLHNINFHPDFYTGILNNYAATYRPLMEGFHERWGHFWASFDGRTQEIHSYLQNIRPAMVNTFLPRYFGGSSDITGGAITSLGRPITVTLRTEGANVPLRINSSRRELPSGWRGTYFSGLPITVTASVPAGFEFDGWEVSGGSAVNAAELTTLVNFTGGNAVIRARFVPAGGN